ncbi:MAG: IS5 family transposase [Kiritimatiellales bacterium]
MKAVKIPHSPQGDLFCMELARIIDPDHALVRLSRAVDWVRFEEAFGKTYCENNGRPVVSVRLMVALHFLKHTFDLSDDAVVDGWVENPYWQALSGNQYFEHKRPVNSSSMTRFRKRIGDAGAEELLKETIASGLRMKAIKSQQLKTVNVDTTVQEKLIRFPTDGRLYNRAREHLVKEAAARGIKLRQNYNRKAKTELLNVHRYAHARQMKRSQASVKTLKNYLGRVIRDIERGAPQPDEELKGKLELANRIYAQQRADKGKVYSVHEPHVECLSKGKAHKKYEFGCKVSVAVTAKGNWFTGACALHGNPYDGHTLSPALEQVKRITGKEPEEAFVDMGYRGHNYTGACTVHVERKRRGSLPKRLWKKMKHRAAVEPSIGHLKSGHRLNRNRLKGKEGDQLNAILSAAGMNFAKLLKAALCPFIFWLQRIQRRQFYPVAQSARAYPLLAAA